MSARLFDLLGALDGWALVVVVAAWVAATVLTLGIVALVVVTLPATYFVAEAPAIRAPRGSAGWLWLLVRNLLGVALILLGMLLSLPGIPGQGLLTMLIGVMLVDFPGRRRLERALARRPSVLAALNRLRARWGKPPLLAPAG
ncbi:MAG TPA: hypothetical protein VLF19_09955 [Methylomirabilota bacterium]|nr:hypothetical protein [Methylomirabilota bacterium]